MSLSQETKDQIYQLARESYEAKTNFFNEIEFKKDLYGIFIIKKMIGHFLRTGNINEKLLMNNIIININCFDVITANKIFRLALNDLEYSVVKSFLVFLDLFIFHEGCDLETNEIVDGILHDTAHRFKLRDKV